MARNRFEIISPPVSPKSAERDAGAAANDTPGAGARESRKVAASIPKPMRENADESRPEGLPTPSAAGGGLASGESRPPREAERKSRYKDARAEKPADDMGALAGRNNKKQSQINAREILNLQGKAPQPKTKSDQRKRDTKPAGKSTSTNNQPVRQ